MICFFAFGHSAEATVNVKIFLGWGLLGALVRLGAAMDAAAQERDLSSCVESAPGTSASAEPACDATHDDAGAPGTDGAASARAAGGDERLDDARPQTPAWLHPRPAPPPHP